MSIQMQFLTLVYEAPQETELCNTIAYAGVFPAGKWKTLVFMTLWCCLDLLSSWEEQYLNVASLISVHPDPSTQLCVYP